MKKSDRRIVVVAGTFLIPLFALVSAHAQPHFEETTNPAGFRHSGETYGASWGDFTGDGLPDLFVNNHRDRVSFYVNNGNGTFSDIVSQVDGSGVWTVAPKQDTHGGSWADFDGDGDQDLYVTTGGAVDGRMLVNEGGVLYDRAPELGLVNDVEGRLPVWVDYDLDGDLDLAMMIRSASRVFRQNNVDPIDFSNVTSEVGLDCKSMDYAELSDLNGDGVVELICGDGTFPQKVYDTTSVPFADISDDVPNVARGTDSGIADFDGDLDPDIFVVAGAKIPSGAGLASPFILEASLGSKPDAEKGVQFDTDGVVTFELYVKRQLRHVNRVHIGSGDFHPADFVFTLDPADPLVEGIVPRDPSIDNGIFIGYDPVLSRWQVILTGLSGKPAGVYVVVRSTQQISNFEMLNLTREDRPERPYLLINTATGFIEDGLHRGLTDEISCISVAAGDFDNDGDTDVYVVCRGGAENLPNRLYENDGDGNFSLVSELHGAEGVLGFHLEDRAGLGDSVVVADYDVDGCLDLFVVNGLPLEPGRHDSGPDQMFRNLCDYGNQWVEIDLEGLGADAGGSNRDGIGARVYVTAGGITQMREQNGGYHRWSQHFKRLHFGLGDSSTITEVRVEWPSGGVDLLSGPTPANAVYLAREGALSMELLELGDGGTPPTENVECGEPSIRKSSETGVFLWRDCPSNSWQMRVTAGGGPKIVYEGQVTAEQSFPSAPTEFSLEGSDFLVGGVQAIQYSLNVANTGWDGFGFEAPASGQTCFEVAAPGGAQIYLGVGKDPVGSSVNLATLGACTPPPALPELTVGDVTVNETDGTATFTVSLSAGSADEVRVDYATADGTATDPDDYTGVSGTLILPPDTLSGEVVVSIIDDGDSEGAETLVLNLSNPVDAELVDASATATIEDNEVYACGEPSIDRASEAGVFLWRDCPSNNWQMRVTAGGGSKIVYEGQVTAEQPFPSVPTEFSWEGADSVVGSAQAILYRLNVANTGWDGFGFETPASGQTCFEVSAPDAASIYVGAGKEPVSGSSVDLATMGACGAP